MMRLRILVATVAFSFLCIDRASAQDAATPVSGELRAAVRALVNEPWAKSTDGLLKGELAYRRAEALAPNDVRIDYAWALMQLRYLRFDEADKTLAGVVAVDGDLWDARRLRIRLAAQMKKHSAAFDEMDRLSERLAAKSTDAARAEERREAIEFLGRMFAFYNGPATKGVTQSALADLRSRVLERLTPTEREQFSRAFGGVNDQFNQLADEKARTAEAAKLAEQAAKEAALKRLEAERGNVAATQAAIQKQAADSEAKTREAVGKLDVQITPLDAELARINTIGQGLRLEIGRLDATVGDLLAQADATDDDGFRNSLLQQANILSARSRRLSFDYQVLDGQAAQIHVRRNALLQERQGHVARYEAEMRSLGVAATQLNRQEKRIDVQTKEAIKPATGNTPLVQSQATTAASLGTYIDLSLEREKSRLLAAFGL
jgi:DNA replication initiation complex subunit (GINS family)